MTLHDSHSPRTAGRLAALGLLLVTLAAPLAAPLSAQGPDPLFSDFEPVGVFELSIAGQEVPSAEIYQSERASAILLVTSKLDSPVLVNLRSRQVQTVALMSLAKRSDGSIDILADAPIENAGSYEVQDNGVKFTYAGKAVAISNKPSLTGRQSAEALVDYDPAYERGAKDYQPNTTLVSELEKQSKAVRVQVFFNSKCHVCKAMVPRIIKLDRTLDTSNIKFDFYGVPDTYSGDEEMERKGISGVPTGIVYVDGKEIGRIIGNEWRIPELALKNVLAPKKG